MEYSLIQINILSAFWVLVGIIAARIIWRREISLGKDWIGEENEI